MGRLSRTQGLALLLCVLFLGLCLGYYLGERSRARPYQVTARSAAAGRSEGEAAVRSEARPESLLEGERIDLNRAPAYDLQRLPGIGASRAQAIIDYREEHGPFRSKEDLMQVSGIGQGIFDAIQDYITVGATAD